MKNALLVAIPIAALSLLGTMLLTINHSYVLSIIACLAILFSVVIIFIYNDFTLLFVSFFHINHLSGFYGIYPSKFTMIGTILLFSPVFFFLKKPNRPRSLILSLTLILSYYLTVFVLRPYALNFHWVAIHIEAIIIFTITQFCNWDLPKIERLLFFHIIAFIIVGLSQALFTDQMRVGGPMLSATAFGVLLVVIWSIWVTIECFQNPLKLSKITITSLLTVLTMVTTGTRMTIIGFTITITCLVFLKTVIISQKPKVASLLKFSTLVIVFCAILFLAWSLLPNDLIIKKNFSSLISGQIDESNLGRLFVWYTSFLAIQQHPLLGVGNGNFTAFIQETFANQPAATPFLHLNHAHNVYLIILSENGILGFLIICIIVFMSLKHLFSYLKQPNSSPSMYGLLVGFLVLSFLALFDAVPYYPSVMSWGAWFIALMMQLPERQSEKLLQNDTSIGRMY